MKVKRVCGCGRIVKGSCDNCSKKSKRDEFRAPPSERGYDNDWRKLSERFRKQYPLCQPCIKKGKITPVADVHHIKPVRDFPELRLNWDNLMSVCRACHKEIEGNGS